MSKYRVLLTVTDPDGKEIGSKVCSFYTDSIGVSAYNLKQKGWELFLDALCHEGQFPDAAARRKLRDDWWGS